MYSKYNRNSDSHVVHLSRSLKLEKGYLSIVSRIYLLLDLPMSEENKFGMENENRLMTKTTLDLKNKY